MHIEKICKVCGIPFIARRENQQFCRRKCFRIDYSRRTRENNAIRRFPTYRCPNCGHMHILAYSPAKEQKRWEEFSCEGCEITNEEILKNAQEEEGISSIY